MTDAKILLVENNSDDEMLTLRALKKSAVPHQIAVVRDGAEALDYMLAEGQYNYRDPRDRPQLVLLDLKLPKVDGLEVLKIMRQNTATSRVPVVVLSTSNEEYDINSCYDAGANSYLTKPVDFQEFAHLVEYLATYWLQINVSPSGLRGD